MKLIDYGKSFEPFTEEKLLNATKRAFMLWRFPKIDNDSFQKLTARINVGEEPDEIKGWEDFWFAVSPRERFPRRCDFQKFRIKIIWNAYS